MSAGTSIWPLLEKLSSALAGRSISAAESSTAGLLMAALADIENASAVFRGGVVTYTTESKHRVLGIDEGLISTHGTVSAECAKAMASRVRELFNSEISLAITGVAGPSEQEGKPVGLTYVGVAEEGSCTVREYRFGGGRASNRVAAVEAALQLAAESTGRL